MKTKQCQRCWSPRVVEVDAHVLIVKTKLVEIQDELTPKFEEVCLKGHGASSFTYAVNKGRAIEISEDNGGFWLEFWKKSDDEDATPVREQAVDSGERSIQEAKKWLG
ncbi:MAG: hypothetical protein HYX68_25730 [Planctomycetes bacterium]|nr:hypothetical protein [Planctomycetota bacterium]